MSNGPATPAAEELDFDRAFALDDAALDATVQKDSGEPAAPAPAAAAETPPDQGTPAVPDGGSGGGNPPDPAGTSVSTEDDWISALPEDAQARIKAEREARKQELDQAEVRYRALHGRLAPTQQALSDAQRRLAQVTATPAQAATPTPQPGQTADSYFDSPAFKAYEADFPGDAKVMREAHLAQQQAHQQQLASLEGKLNALAQRLESTEQVTSRTAIQSEAEKLAAKHPDWQEINESAEFWDYFDDYRARQPKSIRAMYYDEGQLKQMFSDAEFTSAMIDGYKQAKAGPAVVPTTPAATTPESTQPAQPSAQSARVAMSVAPTVRGGGTIPAAIPLDQMDPAQQFEHLWKTIE